MGILQAVGLAIAIIVLRVLMPEVFHAFEHALLSFFTGLEHSMSLVSADNLTGEVSNFINPGFYPQLPLTR